MKKNLFLIILMFIAMTKTLQAQQTNNTKLPKNDSTFFACQLSKPELMKRKAALQKEVFSKVKNIEEISEGYIFHFEDKGELILKLVDYILAEKNCCPFFNQELSIKADGGGISWKISGSIEIKEILKIMLEEIKD